MKTPSQPTQVVDRPALRRKLDAVFDHSIALIVGPAGAGAGKSVLHAQWAGTHPELRSCVELINHESRNDDMILDPSP